MIIRSQDKKRISNIATCNLIALVNTQGTTKNITVDGMVIGTYSTEEKAIKVLDMIEDACRNIAFTDGIVFQMPQDSEV